MIDADASLSGALGPVQKVEERCLPCAAGPDQCDRLARLHMHVRRMERTQLAELNGHSFEPELGAPYTHR